MKSVMAIMVVMLMGLPVQGAQAPSKLGSAVYFISPAHGEVVRSPVKVRFGLTGMGVAPAGVSISETGHHHLLIDLHGPVSLNEPVASDEQQLHYV